MHLRGLDMNLLSRSIASQRAQHHKAARAALEPVRMICLRSCATSSTTSCWSIGRRCIDAAGRVLVEPCGIILQVKALIDYTPGLIRGAERSLPYASDYVGHGFLAHCYGI